MIKHAPLAAAATLAASLFLTACSSEPETISAGPADPDAAKVAAAPKVELPPAIASSGTYRCKDNSLVYISFLSDNMTAIIRATEQSPPLATVKAAAAGQPFEGEGYKLEGSGKQVTYTAPGSAAQSCKS